jgi:hypothetical protein
MASTLSRFDVLNGFDERISRLAGVRLTKAAKEQESIVARMVARGLAISGARVKEQLSAIEHEVSDAIEWAFSEALSLPGGTPASNVNDNVHLLTTVTTTHLENLYGLLNLDGLPNNVKDHVEKHKTEQKRLLEGSLKDFRLQLWRPNKDHGVTGVGTQNTVNIQAPVTGTIQLAGEGSIQDAKPNIYRPEIEAALSGIERTVNELNAADASVSDLKADVATIRAQLQKTAPNSGILHSALNAAYQISLSIGANVLTPQIVTLAALLGVQL